jgi:muramoyltetrapeptide carboxypeptidase
MSSLPRRDFLGSLAGAAATPALATASRRPVLRPPRLKVGDTIGLVSPASATYERGPVEEAIESLQALGFKVRQSPRLRARYGHFAGTDRQRAQAVNEMFADPDVHGVMALTGGSGCSRIVDAIDYGLIARQPKFFGGFSDITVLLNAIHARTGLVTFHSPVGLSEWNDFSVRHFRRVVMDGEAATLQNIAEKGDGLAASRGRTRTLRGGKARGPLLGGNLSVLTALAGSGYWPDWRGAILFVEDVNEYIYRVDRMFSTLRLAGVLSQVAGIVVGQFTHCEPGEGFGTLTLDEVFDDYFKELGVPVFTGSQFGHVKHKFTLPVGAEAEIDADAGTIRLLAPAVT